MLHLTFWPPPSTGGVTQEEGWHFKYGKRHAALRESPHASSVSPRCYQAKHSAIRGLCLTCEVEETAAAHRLPLWLFLLFYQLEKRDCCSSRISQQRLRERLERGRAKLPDSVIISEREACRHEFGKEQVGFVFISSPVELTLQRSLLARWKTELRIETLNSHVPHVGFLCAIQWLVEL